MKLTHHQAPITHNITGHGLGFIQVNGEPIRVSMAISAHQKIIPWGSSFEQLTEDHFAQLLTLEPELVIFGSGQTFRFPHPRLIRHLTQAQIGVETMDNAAACRTYQVLTNEDRRVVLAAVLTI
ncbi:MAG: Xcc1710-like domain-containing protein [Ferrovum sp.]|nr:Xcc1710-like domain-containing protein [Ferrovum sp.]